MFRYLLAVDGSENSKRAAQYLAELTKLRDKMDITAIHVIKPKPGNQIGDTPLTKDSDIERGWQILNEQTFEFQKLGFPIKKQLVFGKPEQAIIDYAQKNDFTQIVVGSRGLTDFRGLLFGSVSHQVLHQSHCPVTLVK
ncbi:universal stress protein [Desulfotomaculum defluvii]